MSITPYADCVRRALDFKNQPSLWVGLGRTTVWPNEEAPQAEDQLQTAIEEAFVYTVPHTVSLVKPVESGGDITVNGQQYDLVADENAYTEIARFCYVRGLFQPASNPTMPVDTFRQHGICVGLVPASGHENDLWIAPGDVTSTGILAHLANHLAWSLARDEQEREVAFVIEFM